MQFTILIFHDLVHMMYRKAGALTGEASGLF